MDPRKLYYAPNVITDVCFLIEEWTLSVDIRVVVSLLTFIMPSGQWRCTAPYLIVGENLTAASGPGERTNEAAGDGNRIHAYRQSCICSASSLSHTVHETHVLPDPRVNICAEWRQTPTWDWWETSSPCSSRSRSQSTVIKELYMHGLRICRWSEPPSIWPYGRHARARTLSQLFFP